MGQGMSEESFDTLRNLLRSVGPAQALDVLIEQFRKAKQYPDWFEARMMRSRLALGLPLVQAPATSEIPAEARAAYEQAMVEAARETGDLFLADGNIPRAWPYLRATGDSARVAEAMERVEVGEDVDAIIGIALQEGVNPVRGFALILQRYGMCRALTAFGMYGGQKDRERCIDFLARRLRDELVERIASAIEREESAKPLATSIPALIAGRDWLFGEYSTYIDTSHLMSLLQYCLEVTDTGTLELFHEFCEYGKRLSSNFQMAGQPPFEDFYFDVDHYALALAGVEVESHLDHFRRKVRQAPLGNVNSQALVKLLVSRGSYQEALEVAMEHFPAASSSELACPTAIQLCQLADRFDLLMQLARKQGDELSYVAASLELDRKTKAGSAA
jgi:hypothetical protein